MAVLGGGICLVATIVSRRRQEEPKGDGKGAPTEAAGRKPRCPSTRTRFGGRLVSALIAPRPSRPRLGSWPPLAAARTRRRRIRGMSRWCARQRNCTAGARRAPVRPEPMTTRYLADRRASGLGVEVHGGRAYRRLMVACETPLLSHAGSDDSRSSRRRHCPVKSGTDNGH